MYFAVLETLFEIHEVKGTLLEGKYMVLQKVAS